MNTDHLLGKPLEYWLALHERVDMLDADKALALEDLLLENYSLRKKLANAINVVNDVYNKIQIAASAMPLPYRKGT